MPFVNGVINSFILCPLVTYVRIIKCAIHLMEIKSAIKVFYYIMCQVKPWLLFAGTKNCDFPPLFKNTAIFWEPL